MKQALPLRPAAAFACLTLLSCAVAAAASSAAARSPATRTRQWGGGAWKNPYTGSTWNNPVSSSLDTMIRNGINRRMLLRSQLRKRGYSDAALAKMTEAEMFRALGGKSGGDGKTPAASGAPAPALAAAPATRFTPAPGGKRLLLATYADELGETTEQKAAFRGIFAEVFAAYEAAAKKHGIADDVAGAAAFFAETHYSLYTGREVSDAATRAMVGQFRDMLGGEKMRAAPAADKQRLYEALVLLTAYTLTVRQVADGQEDPKVKQGARGLAGEGLRFLFGADPARVEITDGGLSIAPGETPGG